MIRFFKGLKRAADFFSIHPEGLSFVTERRLKDVEASVSRLPKAIEDRNLTRIINLEHESYKNFCELEQIVKRIVTILEKTLDKKEASTQSLPVEQAKTIKKPKALKVKAVEEEVKKVKSKLTQAKVKRLFEYRDGELYWKVNIGNVKKGSLAGSIHMTRGHIHRRVGYKSKHYYISRLIFLMFHGYLPEYVSYIDGNSLNTRIENLREANSSQLHCFSRKPKNNTCGYKGVTPYKLTGKYAAQIVKNKKHYRLGVFETAEEAHKAYRKAAKKLHGEFARVA